MKPGRKKVVVRFDEESRRDYLTGFRKRKRERKKNAELRKLKREKEHKREVKQKKRAEMKEKLQEYGLDDKVAGSQGVPPHGSKDSTTTPSKPHTISYDHPNHVVIVDTQPTFGPTLSSLLAQESDDDGTPSDQTRNTPEKFESGEHVAKAKVVKKVVKKVARKGVKRLNKRPVIPSRRVASLCS